MTFITLGAMGTLLTELAWADPDASIPVVSQVVSIKGGTWPEGSAAWGIEAACYRRSDT